MCREAGGRDGGVDRKGVQTGMKEDEGGKDMKTVSTKGETGSRERKREGSEG